MRTEGIAASTTASEPNRFFSMATLAFMACFAVMMLISMPTARAEPLVPEKDELKLGFIKLTDMAPLAIAYEKGYFEEEGLYVTLEPQANWKVLLDGVVDGRLDGSHMLAGQPLASAIGYGISAEIVTTFTMSINGMGVTVANE